MGRGMRRTCRIAGFAAGILAVLLLCLQLVLNSRWMAGKVEGAAASVVKGEIRWSRLHFSVLTSFPRLGFQLDSLSITYPHGTFDRFDGVGMPGSLLAAGRSEDADTLMSAGRISAAVNLWRIFGGKVRLHHLDIHHPRIFYHKYDTLSANTAVFEGDDPEDVPDTTAAGSKGLWLPWISVGRIRICDNPYVVYTSQADTVYASLAFDEFRMKTAFRVKKDILASKLRNTSLSLDSLLLSGRLPADTLRLALDRFELGAPRTNVIRLGLDARALLVPAGIGRLEVPASLDTRFAFRKTRKGMSLDLHHLDADVAYVPLRSTGKFFLGDDGLTMKASALVDDCSLGQVLSQYGENFSDKAHDFRTDAHMTLAVRADGTLSEDGWPEVEASLDIPSSRVEYLPKNLRAKLDLGLSAGATPERKVSAEVRRFAFNTGGLELKISGDGSDILGDDALVAGRLNADAVLDSLVRLLPKDVNLKAGGHINLGLNARTKLSELADYNFAETFIRGALNGERVFVDMPSNGLYAFLERPDIKLDSNAGSLTLSAAADSLALKSGESLDLRIKEMYNVADIDKVSVDGHMVPRLSFSTDERFMRLRSGSSRVGVVGTHVALEAYRHHRRPASRRKAFLDSLQRVYPGVPRDSLFVRAFGHRPKDDFASKDIKVSLDSSVVALLNQWHPGGLVSVERAWVRTPALPLRTSLNSLDIALDDDNASLASFDLSCGSSDVGMKGGFGGFRRFIRGRGPLEFDFTINSERLNVNELLYAMQQGKNITDVESDDDESFLLDSLESAKHLPDTAMRAFVVPRNLRGSVAVHAGKVNWSDLEISPASAVISVRDRCLKVSDMNVATNVGAIKLDAFYASRKMDDIAAGLDMKLLDMSAYDIIHMLPSVDAMMPALKSFQGKFNCDLSVTTQLDTNMNVLVPTLNGLVRVSGEDLYVEDAGSFRKITRLLMFRNKNIGEIHDLSVDAVIRDSRLEVYPFILGVDRYKLALMGTQYVNGKLRYNVSVMKSILPFRFGINIHGNLDRWRFSLGRSKYRNGRVPSFSADLDTMQINIADAIRGIYGKGVQNAMQQATLENRRLAAAKVMQNYSDNVSDALLSKEEFEQLDSLFFSVDIEERDVEVQAEVDRILEESMDNTSKLQKEWEKEHPWAAQAITRAERRRIAREQRKAAAAARKGIEQE